MTAAEAKVIDHEPISTPLVPATDRALTPMDMLDRAAASGASVEVIEKFMALHERWEAGQSRKAFDKAVAAAKAEIKPVIRNRKGHNDKTYADFAAIAREVDPVLSKHGLSYRFRTTQTDRINVTCILFGHGHSEESSLSGPPDASGSKNAIQAIGSTLTYLQRYSLVQMLGVAASDDDDGKASRAAGPITDEQADTLTKLVNDTKTDINKFLKWAQAESISDIPAAKFSDCEKLLKAKLSNKTTEPQS